MTVVRLVAVFGAACGARWWWRPVGADMSPLSDACARLGWPVASHAAATTLPMDPDTIIQTTAWTVTATSPSPAASRLKRLDGRHGQTADVAEDGAQLRAGMIRPAPRRLMRRVAGPDDGLESRLDAVRRRPNPGRGFSRTQSCRICALGARSWALR
jgi:hypothetical protein